jgi:hypothetical protein
LRTIGGPYSLIRYLCRGFATWPEHAHGLGEQAFRMADQGDWGGHDYDDVFTGATHLASLGYTKVGFCALHALLEGLFAHRTTIKIRSHHFAVFGGGH